MPRNRFAKVDVIIDTGNPLLDRTIDGFLKISTVAATRAAAEDAYHIAKTGTISTRNFEESKNAMIGGALTGALVSAVTNGNNDKIVTDALTGAAVATAAEFISFLT
ncbi:unnamed protein product [Amaranthus hypochondriacus]